MLTSLLLAGLLSPSAFALPDDFEVELEGYYRTRGYVFGHVFEGQEGNASVMVQRLRLQPTINYNNHTPQPYTRLSTIAAPCHFANCAVRT